MATNVHNHTVRSVAGHVRHALFPSRSAAVFALGVEVAAGLLHLPLVAHVLLAIGVHVCVAGRTRRRSRAAVSAAALAAHA